MFNYTIVINQKFGTTNICNFCCNIACQSHQIWMSSNCRKHAFSGWYLCNQIAHLFPAPYHGHLIGDSGYPLRPFLLTPYPHAVTVSEQRYNQALQVTRVKIENTFGVLKNRWGGLHSGLRCCPDRAAQITTVCAMLHNFAMERGDMGEDFQRLPPAAPLAFDAPHLPENDDFQAGRARRAHITQTFFWRGCSVPVYSPLALLAYQIVAWNFSGY